MTGKALIIDDEPDIRELITLTLSRLGLEVSQASNTSEALDMIRANRFDLCLTDMRLPDGDGFEVIDAIQRNCPHVPVAVITAHGSSDMAVEALKKGAFDFVTKPLELKRLRSMVESALALGDNHGATPEKTVGLTGKSPVMRQLQEKIAKVARSQAPIFISGESGSGKELVARAIHYKGPRARGPFIAVNCGAIPGELMESEFFGHRKGSFTGATQDKHGLFHAADGGTLFLDEVADLPLHMQVKLLRVIQEKSIRPIGSQEEKSIDVRILSATHKDLAREVKSGHFREDLFYRINVIEIAVPPLRDRKEDIPDLTAIFLKRFAEEAGTEVPAISNDAITSLQTHHFPGNVRELENTLERAFILCSGSEIGHEDLHIDSKLLPAKHESTTETSHGTVNRYIADGTMSIDDYLMEVEREIITTALERNRWNKTATARKLGISFRQLRYKLQKLGID